MRKLYPEIEKKHKKIVLRGSSLNLKDNNFNLIRLFLAVIVVLEHFGCLPFKEINGLLAVRCFFILSGYFIAKSYLSSKNLESYFLKRLKRIYPPIVIIALFAFGVGIFRGMDQVWFISILNFLSFQNLARPENYNFEIFTNPPFWTLQVEFQFYLMLPILLSFWKKNKNKGWDLIALLYLLPTFFLVISPSKSTIIFFYLPFFIGGIALALAEINYSDWLKKNYKPIFVVALTLVLLISGNVWHDNHLFSRIVFPASLAITVIFLGAYLPYLGNICFFGDLSYGIYIYHWMIMDLWTFFAKDLMNTYPDRFFYLISTTVLCAFLSWRLVEKRILNYRKKNI